MNLEHHQEPDKSRSAKSSLFLETPEKLRDGSSIAVVAKESLSGVVDELKYFLETLKFRSSLESGKRYVDLHPIDENKFDLLELQYFSDVENMICLTRYYNCLLYTSPSPRDATLSRMPSSA